MDMDISPGKTTDDRISINKERRDEKSNTDNIPYNNSENW